jgi:hypothetical protein
LLHLQLARAKASRLACVLLALAMCAGAGLFSASAASAAVLPVPVVNMPVFQGTDSIVVTWTAPAGGSGVTGASVSLIGGSTEMIHSALPTDTTDTFSGVGVGSYTASVEFYGAAGISSITSKSVVVSAIQAAAPTYVEAWGYGTTVSADWESSTGADAATSFEVKLNGATTPSVTGDYVTFTGLTPGTYTVSVVAINSVGRSAAVQDTVVLTGLTSPSQPLNVSAKVTAADAVTVTWDAPASNGGAAITKYDVGLYIANGSADSDSVVGDESRHVTVDGNTRSRVFSNVPVGKGTFTVEVWASNGYSSNYAETSPQSLVFAAPPAPPVVPPVAPKPTPPSAVRSVKVSTGKHGAATVAWVAPASTNGAAITGYAVVVGGQEKRVTSTRVSFAGLTKGTYPVRVTAFNAAGTSVAVTTKVVVSKVNAATVRLTLRAGMRGPDVTRLQTALHMPKHTGVFDAATRAAVVKWQKAHHQKASGIVNPAMRAALHV